MAAIKENVLWRKITLGTSQIVIKNIIEFLEKVGRATNW